MLVTCSWGRGHAEQPRVYRRKEKYRDQHLGPNSPAQRESKTYVSRVTLSKASELPEISFIIFFYYFYYFYSELKFHLWGRLTERNFISNIQGIVKLITNVGKVTETCILPN
jgi:hypothetical protein